ncbi:unnamed protein product [Camellia sinensis]
MRNATNSNPNPINNHDYSKRNTQQLQEEGEEDLLLSSKSIVGTCPFMCPGILPCVLDKIAVSPILSLDNGQSCVEERVQRERLRDLSVFERLNGSSVKTSPSLAVKKFCRTISTKNVQASDVRPLPVLEDTLNYLLNLLDTKEHPFEVVHDFIFDRTRSIRQDLSMQNIINNRVIQMFEKMVKFHVISHHKLRRCSNSPNISSKYYLNMEQLTKALTSLYHLYEANRNIQSIYENEAEFRSLYVLLHLGCDNKPMGESLFKILSLQAPSISAGRPIQTIDDEGIRCGILLP